MPGPICGRSPQVGSPSARGVRRWSECRSWASTTTLVAAETPSPPNPGHCQGPVLDGEPPECRPARAAMLLRSSTVIRLRSVLTQPRSRIVRSAEATPAREAPVQPPRSCWVIGNRIAIPPPVALAVAIAELDQARCDATDAVGGPELDLGAVGVAKAPTDRIEEGQRRTRPLAEEGAEVGRGERPGPGLLDRHHVARTGLAADEGGARPAHPPDRGTRARSPCPGARCRSPWHGPPAAAGPGHPALPGASGARRRRTAAASRARAARPGRPPRAAQGRSPAHTWRPRRAMLPAVCEST